MIGKLAVLDISESDQHIAEKLLVLFKVAYSFVLMSSHPFTVQNASRKR